MNLIYSPTAGILVSAIDQSSPPEVHFLAEEEQWSDVEQMYMLSTIQDWQLVESDGIDFVSLVQTCTSDYWVSRLQSLMVCLIEGVSDSLATDVLEHVEGILQSRCCTDEVVNRLLIAPLKEPHRAKILSRRALSGGLSTVGGMLDRLADLQVLLRRFAETWLNFPTGEFADLTVTREEFWQNLAMNSLLTELLEATDKAAFTTAWAALAFDEENLVGRRAVMRIGNLFADALFPTSIRPSLELDRRGKIEDVGDDFAWDPCHEDFSSRMAYSRVMKQVNAIARAVSQGRDTRARKFLRDLIEDQLQHSSREQLLKSLCNIAQECAFMFRSDFERQCLDKALSIAPNDAWTLIQFGNHLKRVGQFEEAIKTLERATTSENARIAAASIADVWCKAGNYDTAVEVYHSIPAWEEVVEVRTGLADVMRHRGEFTEALSEYDKILGEWPDADRALAGKAEVFKRQGSFEQAIALYDDLIYRPGLDRFARVIYRLSQCAVFKHANRLDEAYKRADEVVRMAPFSMLARVHRASILALLGEEAKGLSCLPRKALPRAFGTWITQYCQGLMLLKLDRYSEAREMLVSRFKSAPLASDNQAVLRLGAAFAFLYRDDYDQAAAFLTGIRDVFDYFTEYVCDVLRLHLSVVRGDSGHAAEIARRLEEAEARDKAVAMVLSALREGNFHAAKHYELNLLLRIAA